MQQLFTRPLGVVVLTAAWLLSVPQLSGPQAKAQGESPSPGFSEHSPTISDQKLDATAAAIGHGC